MGAPFEFNWYLVVGNPSEIREIGPNKYVTVKSDNRIYPINSEIPIIVKNDGCLGLIKILSFTVKSYETIIEFEFFQQFHVNNPIAQHYYNMYLYMKNK